jgi:Fic family protein
VGGWGWDEDPPSPREIRLKENLRRAYDRVTELVEETITNRSPFVVSVETLCELHAIVMDGEPDAGIVRRSDNQVGRVIPVFEPPPWQHVESLLAKAFAYINDSLAAERPLHAAAYALWRINWIHPRSASRSAAWAHGMTSS